MKPAKSGLEAHVSGTGCGLADMNDGQGSHDNGTLYDSLLRGEGGGYEQTASGDQSMERPTGTMVSIVLSEGLRSFLHEPTSTSFATLSAPNSVNSQEVDTPTLQRPSGSTTVVVTCAMICGGACVNSAGGIIYELESDATATGISSLIDSAWISMVLTMGTFVGCACFALMDPTNLQQLRARATPRFIGVLLVPSGLDVLVTGLALTALLFIDPALVGILKTTIQVLAVAFLGRIHLGERLSWREFGALVVVVLGVVVVVLRAVLFVQFGQSGNQGVADQAIGLTMITVSGIMGGLRNVVEAALLQDDGLSGSALLLAESSLSAIILAPLCAVLAGVLAGTGMEQRASSNLQAALGMCWRVALLLMFIVSSYGKDAGKFFLVKWASALGAKMLALLFPVGTWMIDLCLYYAGGGHHDPKLGVPWFVAASWLQLGGFALIIGANVYFLDQRPKKK
mmetsp:Transcript_41065/g.109537  ORF Transcript_41065/g.109537 Transcript_41065/m.109537 type:complete len:455 (+) Transcript_41065:178-1542(+)|eukprot:CAMPEP_0119479404 /NCGR_PEP_ID=MMETSP1344-20130328/8690_1 /TAXON_ID=236787 /ORGANISM="Florenciella parvula, Strain CCMP2471" /LENGTH=454 /DNA_ID=CAMNT_0007513635 /DNA_START=136 /DNA_END=1500 /DNA_ORIENTATION=-